MEKVICPYCDSEVSLSAIENEGGCCPECGAEVTTSSLFFEKNAEDEVEGITFDDEDLDEEFDEDM